MKIYLLLAHPDTDSFNGQIADAYQREAVSKGHEVRRQNLGELNFDPILWKGYKVVQEQRIKKIESIIRTVPDNRRRKPAPAVVQSIPKTI